MAGAASKGRQRRLPRRRVSPARFRVDANAGAATRALAGAPLKGVVTARYLFGAAMGNAAGRWTYLANRRSSGARPAVAEQVSRRSLRLRRLLRRQVCRPRPASWQAKSATLDAQGQFALDLETPPSDGVSVPVHRSKATSRMCRASTSPAAPASSCIRRRGTSASAALAVRRPERRLRAPRRRGRARRRAGAGVKVDVTLSKCNGTACAARKATASIRGTPSAKRSRSGRSPSTTAVEPVPLVDPAARGRLVHASRDGRGRASQASPDCRSTRSAPATRRGRATTTTASISCPSRRPTSRATPRGS